MLLRNFFSESDRITNVKIICRDGLVFTHKIIVASVNNFFKDILSIIPDGDEAVLIMPGHEKRIVQKMITLDCLRKVDFNKTSQEMETLKLENSLDPNAFLNSGTDENSDDTSNEEIEMTQNYFDLDEDEFLLDRVKPEEEATFDYENHFDETEKLEYRDSINKLLEELKCKTVSSPSNHEEEKVFKILQRQIQYEKAKLDLLNGNFKTFTQASKAHRINHTTLKRLFLGKKSYIGHNKMTKNVFTTLEEKTIIDDFVQRNNGVKEYNQNLMHRVIWMKIKEIRKSNPERNFSKFVTADGLFQEDKYTAYAIAKKFGLPSKNSRRTIESSIF